MSSTFTIPLVTIPVGTENVGPSPIPDADSVIVLTLDRTVTGGLNSLTNTSVLEITVAQSNDGGVTWQQIAGATWPGGTYDKPARQGGGVVTSCGMSTDLWPGTSRKLQAQVIVTGPAGIAVSGTLSTS